MGSLGWQELVFVALLPLAGLAAIVYLLWLATRLVRAVEKLADPNSLRPSRKETQA